METASSPILHTIRFHGGATTTAPRVATTRRLYYDTHGKIFSSNSLIASPRNCHCYSFCRKPLQPDRFVGNATTRNPTETVPSQKFAVLLEVEGSVCFLYSVPEFNSAMC